MSRRSAIDRPYIGNALERLINEVYARRSRKHASWGDTAEHIMLTLDSMGLLNTYTEPGIDPLATIQAFNSDSDS
jgi:hypothetical protein